MAQLDQRECPRSVTILHMHSIPSMMLQELASPAVAWAEGGKE